MGKNMASHGLSAIRVSEQRTRSRIRLDLVGLEKVSQVIVEKTAMAHHQDSQIELLRHSFDLVKVLAQLLLALREFPAALVIRTEAAHDTINDEKFVFSCGK
jgi:hypothetical protein